MVKQHLQDKHTKNQNHSLIIQQQLKLIPPAIKVTVPLLAMHAGKVPQQLTYSPVIQQHLQDNHINNQKRQSGHQTKAEGQPPPTIKATVPLLAIHAG